MSECDKITTRLPKKLYEALNSFSAQHKEDGTKSEIIRSAIEYVVDNEIKLKRMNQRQISDGVKITIRIDPKLRTKLDVATKNFRCDVSSFVRTSLEYYIVNYKNIKNEELCDDPLKFSLADLMGKDINELAAISKKLDLINELVKKETAINEMKIKIAEQKIKLNLLNKKINSSVDENCGKRKL